MDAHFTPENLVEKLIEFGNPNTRVRVVADFTVGRGDLLRVASNYWPKAEFIGTDLNQKCISYLKRSKPNWKVSKCDFLNSKSREKCKALSQIDKGVDLVLLNPPFSCKGGTRLIVRFEGSNIKCSRAMAFILNSLSFLNTKRGVLLAVLPEGALRSERDKIAWEVINSFWTTEILNENGNNAFRGCSPKTYLVKIKPKEGRIRRKRELILYCKRVRIEVELIRGSISVCSKDDFRNGKIVPFVHSTELKEFKVDLKKRKIYCSDKSFIGPAVLIPRVGKPNSKKVSLHLSRSLISISDCIMALKCKNQATAKKLNDLIIKNWAIFENEYTGTGAPYITIVNLQKSLRSIGVVAKWKSNQR